MSRVSFRINVVTNNNHVIVYHQKLVVLHYRLTKSRNDNLYHKQGGPLNVL